MPIHPFKLERYFARYEFSVKYLLSSSDCESLSMAEVLAMAAPETRELWDNLRLGYTETPGHPLLRQEVARMYETIPPENVIIAAPEEAIFIAMQTLLSPGDHVIALAPVYQSLYEVARSIGCQVTPWTLEPGPDGWRLDLEQLQRNLNDSTRLLVLNFPNNPTGYLPTRQQLDDILTLARTHDCSIFSDEMYRLLEYDPAARLPAVCDAYEKGISLSGLSKAFSLSGLRTGWLATQQSALIDGWLTFKDYTTICNSAPGEILAIMALQSKETILQRNLALIRHNLEIADQFFNEHADLFDWVGPQAGPIAFPRWLGEGPVEDFCQRAVESQGVMIVPGSLFDYPGNHFRIGLGRRYFREALEHVDDLLK